MSGATLEEEFRRLRDNASESARELYDDLAKHLRESGALAGALKEGGTFPDFQLPNAEGKLVARADLLSTGPAIFVFDRGAWCPYCRIALKSFADVAPQIRAAGVRLVAVTPEVGGGGARIKEICGIDFDILCDLDSVLAMQCGLVFPVSDELRAGYLARGIDLERLYGNDSWMLPAPATFMVRSDAKVVRVSLDPDFRYRLEPSEIVKYLAAGAAPASSSPE
jgi:peroxiredoxin